MKNTNSATSPENSGRPLHSARNRTQPVNFYYVNRDAKSVSLIGDFNEWNSSAHPLRRREDGWWFIEVRLTHGCHCYQFLVDGVPTFDPQATEATIEGSLLQV